MGYITGRLLVNRWKEFVEAVEAEAWTRDSPLVVRRAAEDRIKVAEDGLRQELREFLGVTPSERQAGPG